MAIVSINSLPIQTSAEITDIFEVYNLSSNIPESQIISFSDLSSYFFSNDTFIELSAKYDELQNLLSSFFDFIEKSYPKKTDLSALLTTRDHLNSIIEQLETKDKVKREILNDYASLAYADLMKAKAYKNHEILASGVGALRAAILGSVVEPEE